MSWLDRYQDASFRGVGFKVSNHSFELGRKLIVHEYPERDLPYVEDLGRKHWRFTLTGYILGTDYDRESNKLRKMGSRNELLDAIERKGSGKLVHPYLGELDVAVEPGSITERQEEGGICRFTFTFIEQGIIKLPEYNKKTAQVITEDLDDMEKSLLDKFMDIINTVKSKIKAVGDAIRAVFNKINKAIKAVVAIAKLPLEIAGMVGDIIGQIDGFINGAILDIKSVVYGYKKVLNMFGEGSQFSAMLGTLKDIFGLDNDSYSSSNPTTTVGKQIKIATEAQMNMIKGIVATTSIGLAISATQAGTTQERGSGFSSHKEAVEARDSLGKEIDNLIYEETDNNMFIAWRELYNQLYLNVPGEDNDIAVVSSVEIARPMPSLVMAHGLYADVSEELDISRRNSVSHPGFMPANVPLEIRLP